MTGAANTSLLDLINGGFLQVGERVICKDVEGVVTSRGTIKVDDESIEYNTPTAFSKAVTKSTSGGWQQVKLQSSGGSTSLYDIKLKHDASLGKRKNKRKRKEKRKERRGSPPGHSPRSHSVFSSAMSNISLPILVRFRDDDTKRGQITRVSEDFMTFELEYKGKLYNTVSSASKEMYREYAAETGEVVVINSNGFEDLKYQTPRGEWCKLRELFPVEMRKKYSTISQPITYTKDERANSSAHESDDDDYDSEDEHDASLTGSDSDRDHHNNSGRHSPPLSPPISPLSTLAALSASTPPMISPSPVRPEKPPSKRIMHMKSHEVVVNASPPLRIPVSAPVPHPVSVTRPAYVPIEKKEGLFTPTPPAFKQVVPPKLQYQYQYQYQLQHQPHSTYQPQHYQPHHPHHQSHQNQNHQNHQTHHIHQNHQSHQNHQNHHHHTQPQQQHLNASTTAKDLELLVYVNSPESIPYYITGHANSYDELRKQIAKHVPDFYLREPHDMGIYSEFWEKQVGIAYIKPPRNWIDFPKCTSVLLKRVPEEIILNHCKYA